MTSLERIPASRRSLARSPVARRDGDRLDRAAAQNLSRKEHHHWERWKSVKQIGWTTEAISRLPQQYIPDEYSRAVGGRSIGDRHDECARRPGVRAALTRDGECHRLSSDSDEGTPDVTALDQLVEDAIDSHRRKCHRCAARERGVVDAEYAAGSVDERSAGEAVVHRQVEPKDARSAHPARYANPSRLR